MKRSTMVAALMSAFLLTGPFMTEQAVMAAEKDENTSVVLNLKNVQIPVMFKTDAAVKSDNSLHAVLDTQIKKYTEGTLIGNESTGLAQVQIKDKVYYVSPDAITYDSSEIASLKKEKKEAEEKKKKEEAEKKAKAEAEKKAKEEAAKKAEAEKKASEEKAAAEKEAAAKGGWGGSVLTPSAGVNYGPSGKETYYNLPMDGVVSIMRGMGNSDQYWVRGDGVKMLGNYVMVAAHLGIRPRGSLINTSLGMGIVCDTGGFAAGNPTQIDIATAW